MARILSLALLVITVTLFVGCRSEDTGDSQLIPPRLKATEQEAASPSTEIAIVEQLVADRQTYRNSLEKLIGYYKDSGNKLKLAWAQKELNGLTVMSQYNYIFEATVPGPDLKAKDAIPDADYMFNEAMRVEKKARALIVYADEDKLRVALNQYNELIRKYPTSNKIAEAAFREAGIFEYFKDYTISLLYYQRVYQWDPETRTAAKYKAAYILDQYMDKKAEALVLYKEVMNNLWIDDSKRSFAQQRIYELTKDPRAEQYKTKNP
jgi:tetratricopeptide (TPR) repeat protein